MVGLQEVRRVVAGEDFGRSARALDPGSLIWLHVLTTNNIIFGIQLLVVKSKGP